MSDLPVHIDAAKRELQAARRVIDAKTIHDKAKAVEQFAKASNDDTLLAHAREIKIRAKRRAGELLREMKTQGRLAEGARTPKRSREETTPLRKIGITKDFSSEAQKLADADEESFEQAIAKAKATDRVTEGFVEKVATQRSEAKKARRSPDDDPLVRALTRWPLLDSRSLSPDDVLTLAGCLASMDPQLAKIVVNEAPRIQSPPRWDLISRAAKLPKKLAAEVIERYASGDQFEMQVALNLALHQPPAPRREDTAVGDLLTDAKGIAARIAGGWRKEAIAAVVAAIDAYATRANREYRELRERQLAKLREEAA